MCFKIVYSINQFTNLRFGLIKGNNYFWYLGSNRYTTLKWNHKTLYPSMFLRKIATKWSHQINRLVEPPSMDLSVHSSFDQLLISFITINSDLFLIKIFLWIKLDQIKISKASCRFFENRKISLIIFFIISVFFNYILECKGFSILFLLLIYLFNSKKGVFLFFLAY